MLLEDYGLIGDLQSAALVGRNGAVDWLCLPRFDSASCFSALLGDERHGRWLLAPAGEVLPSARRYRPGTLVLETEFETADGAVRVIDFMPRRGQGPPRLMRIVEGVRGRVPMRMELSLRPDYGVDRAVGRARAGRGDRHRRAGCVPAQHAVAAARRGRDGARRVHGGRGRPRAADADLASVLRGDAAGRGRRLGARPHGGVVAGVERALPLRGRVSRGGADAR